MENVIINGNELEKMIKESIPAILKDKFTSTHSNPLADAIVTVLKEQDSVIKDFVRGVISEMLNSEELKKKISNEVVMSIVQKGLRG